MQIGEGGKEGKEIWWREVSIGSTREPYFASYKSLRYATKVLCGRLDRPKSIGMGLTLK
jgi:hypothetical protein